MYECVNDEIKEFLLRKMPVPGRYLTAIQGLTLLRGDEESRTVIDTNILSVIVFVQGIGYVAIGDKNFLYAENEYFITTSQSSSIFHCINTRAEKPFLTFSLTISRHVFSLLGASPLSVFPKQRCSKAHKSYGTDINIDLIKCFERLIKLFDKPEQIYIRAPIIICEIHYLLLVSNKW